ncbi:MAG: TolC family protein [Candidatus Pseudobacter hemicellulosilyticus]|uniref:TolC family protein n=1 Tax=Candidatus Pseudobacter hemicellulosilyticus TaxID=3121375 RepID=A0AAJ5WNC3_9BACT|nr:MAG: TolC family protein [Pseudobacter sp.]
MKLNPLLLITGLLLSTGTTYARDARQQPAAPPGDTLHLPLSLAEKRFLDSNLVLLAGRYNIGIAQAEVITARLYNNPELTVENVLFNPDNSKWLDLGWTGNNIAELTQVITLAGKRNKAIRLAESGVKLSEHEFYDLLRTLRYTLRDDFFRVYFGSRSLRLYDQQISSLQQILGIFDEQLRKGNIAASEVLRIQSLLYNLQSERSELQRELQETITELKTLTRVPPATPLIPIWDEPGAGFRPLHALHFQQVLDSALINRQDLLAAREGVRYEQLNEQLQKALAVPDLTVGLTYDKQGNFTRNYNGLQLSMPLPFFNRNQGNIRQAGQRVAQSKVLLLGKEEALSQEVMQHYLTASQTEQLFANIDTSFQDRFSSLIEEARNNYMRRNISMLQFLDLYNSYKETLTGLDDIRYHRYRALESLNYIAGAQLIQF